VWASRCWGIDYKWWANVYKGMIILNIKLDIIKQHGNYIVRRTDGEYNQHAHISTMGGCRLLIDCIKRNKLPKSKYLVGSCKRLLTEKEYESLKKPKDCYYNVNRGIR